MFLKSLTFIVLLGFVTGQMSVFPHAHAGGGQPSDHSARSHIHVARLAHTGHCHDNGHCHHHHADGSHSHMPTPVAETEQDQHDSDAVYLPNDIDVSLPNKGIGPVNDFEFLVTLTIPVAPSIASVTDCVTGPFFSGDCSPGRPLYIALRALRI